MGRITDYGSFMFCEICDHLYLPFEYDDDARMCKECARVNDEARGEEDG